MIRHYAVRVCQIEPEGQCEDHQATGTTTLELTLHPHYRYSWTVAAYTIARGPYNQSLPFQMPEDSKCMMSCSTDYCFAMQPGCMNALLLYLSFVMNIENKHASIAYCSHI